MADPAASVRPGGADPTAHPTILRKSSEPERDSFADLRRRAIDLVQLICGDIWTDYNLHDPGVTILEQVCYALTDLLYRVDCSVPDHLTGSDGRIDFFAQALPLPVDALPCRPTTLEDYRSSVLAAVPELDDIWVRALTYDEATLPDGVGATAGLMAIAGRPRSLGAGTASAARGSDIARSISSAYRAHRNLCEDLHERVHVAEPVDCDVVAEIEVDDTRAPDDVLADVYAAIEQELACSRDRTTVRALLDGEATLEEVFDGPAEDGHIRVEHPLERDDGHVHAADLIARIVKLPGVVRVRHLAFQPDVESTDRLPRLRPLEGDALHGADALATQNGLLRTGRIAAYRLRRPAPPASSSGRPEPTIALVRGGRQAPLSGDYLARYDLLVFRRRAEARARERQQDFYTTPRGRHRDLARYHSIQHHFPLVYGVGPEGRPRGWATDRPDRDAELARQLKGYLLLIDQVLANQAADIAGLGKLFSTAAGSDDPTYRGQSLGAEQIPGFRASYGARAGGAERSPYRSEPQPHVDKALSAFEPRRDRRGRLLDRMLAVHGERVSQPALSSGAAAARSADERFPVERKRAFLRAIPEVTRDRTGAFDYGSKPWFLDADGPDRENVPGFRKRVGLLLGIEKYWRHGLVDAGGHVQEGFHLVEHILLRPSGGRRWHDRGVASRPDGKGAAQWDPWRDFYPLRLTVLLPGRAGRFADADFRSSLEETFIRNCPAHVLPSFYWLSSSGMRRFEERLRAWLEAKYRATAMPDEGVSADASASALIDWIRGLELRVAGGKASKRDGPADG